MCEGETYKYKVCFSLSILWVGTVLYNSGGLAKWSNLILLPDSHSTVM